MEVVKPPRGITKEDLRNSVFLAGSIEMGAAIDWQKYVEEKFSDTDFLLMNPRRDEWDSSWEQKISNPQFKGQVDWELGMLEKAEIALFYFAPNTKSPISLLELGLFKDKAVVICPEGFWRKGNVDIVCDRYKIPQFETLPQAIDYIKNELK